MPSVPLTPEPCEPGPATARVREPQYGFTLRRLRLQSTGALPPDALYVERAADEELRMALLDGELCSVVGTRQLGKSSLRLHVARQLEFEHGRSCVHLDLNAIGLAAATSSGEGFYFALVQLIADALRLADPLPYFQRTGGVLSPAQRFRRYLRDVVLARTSRPVVLFVDHLECLNKLGVDGGELFAVIRALYDERAQDPELRRLTFCLLGVAEANSGRSIRLRDFTRRELAPFAPTLAALGGSPAAWLDAIYSWTAGHPAMTHSLCERLEQSVGGTPLAATDRDHISVRVDDVVERTFLAHGRAEDPSLCHVATLLGSQRRYAELVARYRRLLRDQQEPLIASDSMQLELASLGLCAVRTAPGGSSVLHVRNRIFERVFNDDWAGEQAAAHRWNQALRKWRDSGKNRDALPRGAELTSLEQWALAHASAVSAEQSELLLSSISEAQRQTAAAAAATRIRRQQLLIVALVTMLVCMTLLCLVLYAQVRAARSHRSPPPQHARAVSAFQTRRVGPWGLRGAAGDSLVPQLDRACGAIGADAWG